MTRRYAPAFGASALLHALVVALAGGWLFRISPAPKRSAAPDRVVTVFVVAPEDARFPGLNPVDPARSGWIDVDDVPSTVAAGEFAFDVARITERAHLLFPFLVPGLALEHFAAPPVYSTAKSLSNPFAAAGASKDRAGRPLTLDAEAQQRIVDKTWSRRARWSAFDPIRRLSSTHSGRDGQLPALLQRYCDQNALQPYADTTIRDPRLWVQLGIVADHADFIGYIRQYASEHPSTRATTALLFLLDTMAVGSLDALGTLLESDPIEDLAWTRGASPRAHELLARLQRHYRRELDRRGLTSAGAITMFFESIRLGILDGIVRTTPDGYRASDARYLAGTIYWRQRRYAEALRSWRGMTVDPADSHVQAYSQILRTLEKAASAAERDAADFESALHREISQILKNAGGRWLVFSYDRLRQFGYAVDTF